MFLAGNCRMFVGLPQNSTMAMSNNVDQSWVSTANDCDMVARHFKSINNNLKTNQLRSNCKSILQGIHPKEIAIILFVHAAECLSQIQPRQCQVS